MSSWRFISALLVALLMLSMGPIAGSAQTDPTPDPGKALQARLGGPRSSFERQYGEADSANGDCKSADGCIAIYTVEGFNRIQVLYAKNRALWIQLHANRSSDLSSGLADPADWSTEAAYDLARTFLPIDAKLDSDDAYPNADADLISPCHSESLVTVFFAEMYASAGAAGEQGDCQLVFLLVHDAVAILNVMLGDGPFPAGLERPDTPLTIDDLAYLDRTDQVLATALDSITLFRQEIGAAAPNADRIAVVLGYWQTTLPGLLEEAPSEVLEPFYDRYIDAAVFLGVAGAEISAVIAGDNSRIESGLQNLASAERLLRNLRDAVAAYAWFSRTAE